MDQLFLIFIRNMLNKQGIECPNYYLDSEDIRRKEISINNGKCIVPEGITSIGIKCFYGCTALTSVQLPSSLRRICGKAFSSSWQHIVPLKQVVVPKTCVVEECAFEDYCEVIFK